MVQEEEGFRYKISLIGDGGVGKTSLVRRYVHDQFDERYMKTLGTNVYSKEILLNLENSPVKTTLQIWDVMGQRVFKSVIKSALANAKGVILVCDLTDYETLKNLLYWIRIVYNNTRRVSFCFLGNKSDKNDPQFGLSALSSLASCFGAQAYLTSAKSGTNVEKAFVDLVSNIYKKQYVPPKGKFDFNLEDIVIDPIIKVEDRIINAFCQGIGGLEIGILVVQEIYKELQIDFSNVNKEELDALVTGMIYYLAEYEPELKDDLGDKLRRILTQL